MRPKSKSDIIVGVALILISFISLWATFQIEVNLDGGSTARLFPLAGTIALFLCGLIELFKTQPAFLTTPVLFGRETGSVLLIIVLSFIYILAISRIGYILSTSFAAVAVLWIFGSRSLLGLALGAVLCPLFYHLIFFELLGVFPPYGIWFDLLDHFQRS